MGRNRTVADHEILNLHIRKSTVYGILRSLLTVPIYLYCMIGFFFSLKPEMAGTGFPGWWTFAPIIIYIVFGIVGLYGVSCFIAWKDVLSED